jgi:uncharacterized protein (DUF427 family)
MGERRSLFHRYPDYRVDLDPEPRRVRVRVGDEWVADSRRALVVRETNHEPVHYLPMQDVRDDLIEASQHSSFCPFKGDASYWSIRVGDRVEENVIWGYVEPFEEVSGLAGHVAFYPDRVQWQLDD